MAAYTMWHRIIHIICDNVELSQFSFSFLFVVKFTSNRWTKYIRIILYVVLLMLYSPQNEHHTSKRDQELLKLTVFPVKVFIAFSLVWAASLLSVFC